jgi:peptide-methionine (S)-S-oxide reductase
VNSSELLDLLFREAVAAIDAGDVTTLERLIAEQPRLLRDRLEAPGAWLRDKVGGALDGFFQKPYLLWFVAEDPVRNGTLPANIAQVTRAIISAARREGVANIQEQLDTVLRLVSWSGVAAECGVQLELIDVLIDAGASPEGNPDNALVNGHIAAAEHLVERGATLSLSTALCLGRWEDVTRLAPTATDRDMQLGFILSALNGKAEALRRMIDLGIDVNARSADLYSHATALHHAVCSGSLDAVRVLVDAGAGLDTRDTAWNGTPLGWAEHYQAEHERDARGRRYAEIAAFLRARGARDD